MRTRISLLIPAVALASALAACGDGAPSKASFVTKADAACAPGNSTISNTAKPTNAPQVASAAGSAADTLDGQVRALQALKLPGGKDKETMQTVITSIGDVRAPTRALQDAATKTDDAAMAKAAVDVKAKSDAAANWGGLAGLTQCGTQLKTGMGNIFDGVKNVVKASYVLKAENLCREYYRKSDAVPMPGKTTAAQVKYFEAQEALSVKLVNDLRAVTAPPGDEGTVADFLGAMETVNNKANDLVAAAKNNPRLVGGLIDELNVATTAVNAKLDAYGLKVCGSAGG